MMMLILTQTQDAALTVRPALEPPLYRRLD
jgi:hypothetical protein